MKAIRFVFFILLLLAPNLVLAENYWNPSGLQSGGTISGDLIVNGFLYVGS